MPDALSLYDAKESLEQEGTLIAFDFGEHGFCLLGSNCPRAVEFRRILADAGVEWEKIAAPAREENTFTVRQDALNPVNGIVRIGTVEVDYSRVITENAIRSVQDYVDRVNNNIRYINRMGEGFYASYRQKVADARKGAKLPQLKFTAYELRQNHCTIGITDDNQYYMVAFDYHYAPKWLYSDGKRFSLSEAHAKQIERDVLLVFFITHQRKLLPPMLMHPSGRKLQHYHGHGTDCWGSNKLLEKWDGSLGQLTNQFRILTGAVATINMNSLMMHNPEDMPHVDELKRRCTLMGEEGSMAASTNTAQADANPRGWGRIPTGGRP